jgi:ABC-type multidrug transport system permease subunit
MLLISSKKIKGKSALKNYLLQSSILLVVSTFQATILTLSLYLIGFAAFGINMLFLFLTIIIISVPLILLIQGIRFIIPHKIFGILLLLVLLIIQMATIGGVFGPNTTSTFYKVLSYIMPITYVMRLVNIALYSFT